jgi:hypothetical protein
LAPHLAQPPGIRHEPGFSPPAEKGNPRSEPNSGEFGRRAYPAGVETHDIDATPVRIYSREKTIVDAFKYRNKIGLDTAALALRRYRQQGRIDAEALRRHAQACRVANVMRPYLEALL